MEEVGRVGGGPQASGGWGEQEGSAVVGSGGSVQTFAPYHSDLWPLPTLSLP